ncbi:hypothetical protein CRUP_023511 [Coryphaenoides rupestris]|nr:hypothetical protein CRUP_023511 [Coryphaenoides rupestris]
MTSVEEPRLGSAPLAMLAATCSRIGDLSPSSSSSSPAAFLHDGTSGLANKGFHPWRRAAPCVSSLGANFASSLVGTHSSSRSNACSALSAEGVNVSAFSSAFSVSAPCSTFGNEFSSMYPATTTVSSDSGVHEHTNAHQRSVFLSKFPASVDGLPGIYPRMPAHHYESWFKPVPGEVGNVSGGSPVWWDMGTGWVDAQSPVGLPPAIGGYSAEYGPLSHGHAALSPGGAPPQHLLQANVSDVKPQLLDSFRPSITRAYSDSVTAIGGPALTDHAVLSLPAASSRSSSRRYTGKATDTENSGSGSPNPDHRSPEPPLLRASKETGTGAGAAALHQHTQLS